MLLLLNKPELAVKTVLKHKVSKEQTIAVANFISYDFPRSFLVQLHLTKLGYWFESGNKQFNYFKQ